MKTCCICNSSFEGFGANPEPFDGPIGDCCNTCDSRFVIPVRIMFGRDYDDKLMLDVFKRLASLGAGLERSRNEAMKLWQEAQAAKTAANVTPIR